VTDPTTRDQLLDAAWKIVTEHGVEGLTLAQVGERVGVSRQAVYLHFGNRATLLTAMAARIDHTSGFRRKLAAAQARPPVPAYLALLEAWFSYLPTILPVALALEGSWLSGGDGGDAYRDRMNDWHAGIRLAIQRLDDSGQLASGWNVSRAADWTWATIHPTHYHHLTAERGWTAKAARQQLTTALTEMLVATTSQA